MTDIFDAIMDWDVKNQKLRQIKELDRDLLKEKIGSCGGCYFWMKSNDCPRERNINGWNKGPSMSDIKCDKFQRSPSSIKYISDAEKKRSKLIMELEAAK
jgi:hypothetical protein